MDWTNRSLTLMGAIEQQMTQMVVAVAGVVDNGHLNCVVAVAIVIIIIIIFLYNNCYFFYYNDNKIC